MKFHLNKVHVFEGGLNQHRRNDELRASSPLTTTADHSVTNLLQLCSLEDEEDGRTGGGRWHLYHTHTGRLTGFLRERQKIKKLRAEQTQSSQTPWKPPYTNPLSGPETKNNCVTKPLPLCLDASVHKCGDGASAELTDMSSVEEEEDIDLQSGMQETVTYARWTTDVGTSDVTEVRVGKMSRVREALSEGAKMRHKTFTLAER